MIFPCVEFHSDMKVGNAGSSVKYVPRTPSVDNIKIKAIKKSFVVATIAAARYAGANNPIIKGFFLSINSHYLIDNVAVAHGVEPRPYKPESLVLPLDNAPRLGLLRVIIDFGTSKCQVQVLNLKGHL